MRPAVREAVEADRPALVDLWVEAWQATMPDIDFEARRAWFGRHLDTLASAGAKVLVAGDEHGVAGFVTVDLVTGDLDQLAVARQRQGSGVAMQLIGVAKALSPTGLRLTVNTGNPRAIALYERADFCVTGYGISARSGLPVQHMAWSPR